MEPMEEGSCISGSIVPLQTKIPTCTNPSPAAVTKLLANSSSSTTLSASAAPSSNHRTRPYPWVWTESRNCGYLNKSKSLIALSWWKGDKENYTFTNSKQLLRTLIPKFCRRRRPPSSRIYSTSQHPVYTYVQPPSTMPTMQGFRECGLVSDELNWL